MDDWGIARWVGMPDPRRGSPATWYGSWYYRGLVGAGVVVLSESTGGAIGTPCPSAFSVAGAGSSRLYGRIWALRDGATSLAESRRGKKLHSLSESMSRASHLGEDKQAGGPCSFAEWSRCNSTAQPMSGLSRCCPRRLDAAKLGGSCAPRPVSVRLRRTSEGFVMLRVRYLAV